MRHTVVNPVKYGTCYEDAWRYLIKEEEGALIHGSLQLSAEGPRVNHAWVELPTGWVWEPQTKSYYTIEDFKMMGPAEERRYTVDRAAAMAARTGNFGPWVPAEHGAGGNPAPEAPTYYHSTEFKGEITKFKTSEVWFDTQPRFYGERDVIVDYKWSKPFVTNREMVEFYDEWGFASKEEAERQISENRKKYIELGGESNPASFQWMREQGYDLLVNEEGYAALYPGRVVVLDQGLEPFAGEPPKPPAVEASNPVPESKEPWRMTLEEWTQYKATLPSERVAEAIKLRELQTESAAVKLLLASGKWIDFPVLERSLSIAPDRVGGALRRLQEKNVIEVIESKMGPGGLTPSKYRLKEGALKDYPELTRGTPALESELSQIKGIGIFGSAAEKPVAEAGDIDLAIGRELTKEEVGIVQGISNRYGKKIEVFQGDEIHGLLENETIGKQIFQPNKKPYWEETYVGKGFFSELREVRPTLKPALSPAEEEGNPVPEVTPGFYVLKPISAEAKDWVTILSEDYKRTPEGNILVRPSDMEQIGKLIREDYLDITKDFTVARPRTAGNPDAKEPWQMTRAEHLEAARTWRQEYMPRLKGQALEDELRKVDEGHRRTVEYALAKGKPVPPEVLAEYSDLARKANPPAVEDMGIPKTYITSLGFRVELPVARAVDVLADYEIPVSSGFHGALNDRWTMVFQDSISPKLRRLAEELGFEIETRPVKGTTRSYIDVSLPGVSVNELGMATDAFDRLAERYIGKARFLDRYGFNVGQKISGQSPIDNLIKEKLGLESNPPFERLGKGEIAKKLLPMPPDSGPPLPRILGLKWPWKE